MTTCAMRSPAPPICGRSPQVDAAHIGITGTSYGGILSMDAVAFAPPGVFQAAIPCSGYGDFLHMADEQELRHIKLLEFELGKLPEAEATYRRSSSIYALADATTPCFLIHGEGRYPGSSSSRDFAAVLEANYKPFWYKAFPGETYYVASIANVRQMLSDMRAFFDFYLKGIPHQMPESVTAAAHPRERGRGPVHPPAEHAARRGTTASWRLRATSRSRPDAHALYRSRRRRATGGPGRDG